MSWADYRRHLAEGQRVLGIVDARAAAISRDTTLLYAIAQFLAALAAAQDPGGGLIESTGTPSPERGPS